MRDFGCFDCFDCGLVFGLVLSLVLDASSACQAEAEADRDTPVSRTRACVNTNICAGDTTKHAAPEQQRAQKAWRQRAWRQKAWRQRAWRGVACVGLPRAS